MEKNKKSENTLKMQKNIVYITKATNRNDKKVQKKKKNREKG